jgi:serine/threonine-protein phosphatase 2B regulatory subunit
MRESYSRIFTPCFSKSFVVARMKFAFMLYDESSTGSITHTELVKILRANHLARTEAEVSRKAETIIAQCDKRNDGTISFDEFAVVAKKFPNILFPAHQK